MPIYDLKRDFKAEVLDRSRKAPVLVDFWAEWCGPCKILGPVLEKLAREANGAWDLVKVDTEAFSDVAGVFRIQAIPTVMLFDGGEPVAAFQGALAEPQVRQWLTEHLPAVPASDMDAVRAAIAAGRTDEARRLLLKMLAAEPENGRVRLLLARLRFPAEIAAVRELLEPVAEGDEAYEEAQHILFLCGRIAWAGGDPAAPAHPDGSPESLDRYRVALLAAAGGDFPTALDGLLELVSNDRKLDEDGPRRAMVALFDLLGEDDPRVPEYRRKLTWLLY